MTGLEQLLTVALCVAALIILCLLATIYGLCTNGGERQDQLEMGAPTPLTTQQSGGSRGLQPPGYSDEALSDLRSAMRGSRSDLQSVAQPRNVRFQDI